VRRVSQDAYPQAVLSGSHRLLMASSALGLCVAGIAASFLPREILAEVGVAPVPPVPVLVQLLGALLLGFAVLNWLGKEMLVGGVYGRPIVVGNLGHFVIGTLTLLRAAVGGDSLALWAATGVYAGFAIWFGLVLFTPPSKLHAP
jgi:hypothetical protein